MLFIIAMTSKDYGDFDTHFLGGKDEVGEDGVLTINRAARDISKYADFLPTWDPKQKYPPLEFVKYDETGLRADPSFPNILPTEAIVKKITPKFGSEIDGVQLSALTDAGKDELALLVAQRGVLVFRNQDFATFGPKFAADYGRHFGRLHIHPTSGAPRSVPELHITYRRPDPDEFARVFSRRNQAVSWHSDVSYELQPPGVTFFSVLEGPDGGGDTIFADTVEAYRRLSPEFQKRIAGLHVLHTSEDQASNSRLQGGIERRKPVSNVHPLVRVHPATGEKAIYLNKSFARKIVELKEEESEALLHFLNKHVEQAHDLQLRAKWEPNTVVVWDNRRTVHSAIIDWESPVHRHAFRITTTAERPVEDLADLNKENYDVGDLEKDLKVLLN